MLTFNIEPSQIMYAKLIDAFCQDGDMKRARWVFDLLVERGITHDVITYTMMINGYCRVNCLWQACGIFNDMKERGIKPDVITYTALLDGRLKENLRRALSLQHGKEMEVEKTDDSPFWNELNDMGKEIEPDVYCYTVLIDGHCKTNNLQDAIDMYDEMIARGLQPDIVTYTALMSSCWRKGDRYRVITLVDEILK